jgi:flagellar assembly protein FliH
MNMLSKIVRGEDSEKLVLETYHLPSADDLEMLIAEKKRQSQRSRIIDDNKEDPVQAARNEANKILIEAQEKLKAAEVEANVLKNRKEKELRMQLEKEFQARLDAEVKKLQQNYIDSLEELGTMKQMLYKKSENQLLQLVFSISRKVIDSEIASSPEVVVTMLKKGFDKIKEAKEVEIKINPVDYATIENKKGEIKEILKSAGAVKFVKDDQIERGGCQIITEHGEISSEPGKQLDIIKRELSNGA